MSTPAENRTARNRRANARMRALTRLQELHPKDAARLIDEERAAAGLPPHRDRPTEGADRG